MFCLVARQEERNLAAAVEVAGEGSGTLDLKLDPAVTLTGRIVDPDGKGIPNAQITPMLNMSSWGSSFSLRADQTR